MVWLHSILKADFKDVEGIATSQSLVNDTILVNLPLTGNLIKVNIGIGLPRVLGPFVICSKRVKKEMDSVRVAVFGCFQPREKRL